MSKRNSQAAKTAARERLRAEREREAKRAKARRQIIVALSVVGVLAAAGGVGYAIVQANKPDGWEAAKNAKLVKPAHSTGKDGTYDKWALVMSKKFDADGRKYDFQGTPSLVMDGKKVTGSDGKTTPMSVADFNTAIQKALNS